MKASTRVVVNTSAQYLRTAFSVAVSLFTTRIVLANLGVDDYGIFNLIAGVVTMLAFIQNNLSRSTQRFLSYYHGKGELNTIRQIFNNSYYTQFFISIIVCGTLLAFTPIVFRYFLNIAPERENVAHTVYYLSLASLFFNFQSTPFLAVLIARENIVYSTFVQFIDTVLKIPIAFSLILISKDNRLEWYSLCMMSVTALNYLCYAIYCKNKYNECKGMSLKLFEWKLAKEMFSFMGWGIYGTFCIVLRNQGVAILLNKFYTAAINAAFGLGNLVAGQMNVLSSALTTAINPQIIKAEGSGNRTKMFTLTEISCKFSFLLFSVLAIPILFSLNDVLHLWLSDVPPYTHLFCSYIILTGLSDQLTVNLAAANQAIGNIRKFTVYTNTLKFCTVPVALIVLYMGGGALGVMITYLLFELSCAVVRLFLLKISINLSITSYIQNVLLKIIPPVFLNCIVCFLLSSILTGWWFIVSIAVSAIVTLSTAYFMGLTSYERTIIQGLLQKMLKRSHA